MHEKQSIDNDSNSKTKIGMRSTLESNILDNHSNDQDISCTFCFLIKFSSDKFNKIKLGRCERPITLDTGTATVKKPQVVIPC